MRRRGQVANVVNVPQVYTPAYFSDLRRPQLTALEFGEQLIKEIFSSLIISRNNGRQVCRRCLMILPSTLVPAP